MGVAIPSSGGVVVDAYGERKAAEVMEDTWGHLRAKPNARHHGTIVFAEGEYGGERVILSCDFGESAGYGPWFYHQIHDWLFEQDIEPGNLYTFIGWYRTKRDDSWEFRGEITFQPLGQLA